MAKTAILINKDALVKAIAEAESKTHETLGGLYDSVVEIYNASSDVKITAATTRNRMLEWGLSFKNPPSGKRGVGRVATEVDKDRLVASLTEAEKDGPLANRSLLYVKVSEIYNNGCESPISPSVVNLRIETWNLEPKTPKARIRTVKDIGASETSASESDNSSDMTVRYGKEMTHAQNHEGIMELLQENKMRKYKPLALKIKKGSKSAAIKLNCLQCTGFEKKEIKYCTCTWCPLFSFRPYQSKKSKGKIELPQV